jgi:hypothetical protein
MHLKLLIGAQVMCENPKCDKTKGPLTNPTIMATYQKHLGMT